MVSSVYASTPPSGYGGIQRVVHALTQELIRQGHDVVLMAPPGSWCDGRTISVTAYDPSRPWTPIRRISDMLSEEALYEAMREFLAAERVDIVHDWSFHNLFALRHPDRVPFVISTSIPPPPGYNRPNLVACSAAHAALCGGATRFVHYGLPLDEWPVTLKKGHEIVHIAKIARYKGQHLAIAAALRTGRALTLAGNVEDHVYHRWVIRPLLCLASRVQYIGEIAGTREHLRTAAALVQTPRWFDALPLVVLEALASATPVIALAEGGIPEQIVHGETGFLCRSLGDLIDAFERLMEIDPARCRAHAEEHFAAPLMAKRYVELYERAIDGERW
jgi:glycosyltransferase involved in cell wall biosynthesis